MSKKPVIDLHTHQDYVVSEGVGKTIVWHGQSYKTHAILPEVADRMAREPETQYIKFSDARIARETEARVEALVKAPATAKPAEAPAAKAPAAAAPAPKTEEPADKASAGKAGGKPPAEK